MKSRLSALNPRVAKRRTGAPIPEAPEYLSVVYSVVRRYWGRLGYGVILAAFW